MQYCDKCKAYIDGERRECPLCQGSLTGSGDNSGEIFPLIPSGSRRFHLLKRSLIFASGAVVVLSAAVNFLVTPKLFWWVLVAAAVVCMWVSLSSAIRRRHNIPKNIIWQVVIVSALAVGWDYFTHWRGWSLDYVVPAICVLAMAAVSGFAVYMRLHFEEFMIYLILDGLLGILPLFALLTGNLGVIYPSVICIAISLLSFCALFSFAGDALKTEIKKRLHL